MKTKILRLLVSTLCLTMVLIPNTVTPVDAQEKVEVKKVAEKPAPTSTRRRYGANKATAEVDGEVISILAGRPNIEKDTAYPEVDLLKTGDFVKMNLSQAVKFSTPFNVKFGNLEIKKENVAPNYPGVYSLWMKKTDSGWNIVFNNKPDIWGTMHNTKHDVGETPAAYTALDDPVSNLKLEIEAGNGRGMLSITWGKHQWKAPFTIEP